MTFVSQLTLEYMITKRQFIKMLTPPKNALGTGQTNPKILNPQDSIENVALTPRDAQKWYGNLAERLHFAMFSISIDLQRLGKMFSAKFFCYLFIQAFFKRLNLYFYRFTKIWINVKCKIVLLPVYPSFLKIVNHHLKPS